MSKPAFKLFYSPDAEDGSFSPSEDIEALMSDIEAMSDNEHLDDYDAGVFYAIQEVLSTPTALLPERVKAMLEQVYDNGVTNSLTALQEAGDIDEEEEEPMQPTVEELDKWYKDARGVFIQGWHSADHVQKIALKQNYLEEQEKENRDLTDEEMLQELAEK